MAQIPNSLGIPAPIAPFDSNDTYPTHLSKYGKGGYISVATYQDLLGHPGPRVEDGMLAYVLQSQTFYIRAGLDWNEIDILSPQIDEAIVPDYISPVQVSPDDVPAFLEGLDRGSKYIIYVDPNHNNATDSKTNKGNSALRPFKSIERACLEASRKSFKAGGTPGAGANDFSEKVTIYLAPATYYVQNGRGGTTIDLEHGKRLDAADLIFANKDWLINEAYDEAGIQAYINGVYQTDIDRNRVETACKRDLGIFISAVSNDLAAASTINVVNAANAIKPLGQFIPAYDNSNERTETNQALTSISNNITQYVLKNIAASQGGVNISGIIVDSDPVNPCASLRSEAATLLGIISSTLSAPNGVMPPAISEASRGSYNMAFPDSGEPTPQNLRSFNSPSRGGIILPRGISIVGADLRKVIIRPGYVPPKDGSEGKSAIFRMTGGNFFSGFTIRDKEGLNESHHNLSAFEFCSSSDLEDYYDNITRIFKDNTQYNLLFDSSNLIYFNSSWIKSKMEAFVVPPEHQDYKEAILEYVWPLVYALSRDLRNQTSTGYREVVSQFDENYTASIIDSGQRALAVAAVSSLLDHLNFLFRESISNRANRYEGGYQDPQVPVDVNNPTNPCQGVQDIITTFISYFKAVVANTAEPELFPGSGAFLPADVEAVKSENKIVGELGENTVSGASPYIYSATLRSIYGMSGIDGDGSKVSGFKSYLAAQFTVISLQNDPNAFYPAAAEEGEVANTRYKGTRYDDFVGISPRGDWRHFGYKVSNEAYAQLVSCFCIGPAVHYWAESGAEFSITNSTSNFGDISLQAYGYVGQTTNGGAYDQDKNYKLLGIVPPKSISKSPNDARYISVGTISGFATGAGAGVLATMAQNNGTITLENPIDLEFIAPYSLKVGSRVYVRIPAASDTGNDFIEVYATVLSGEIVNGRTIPVQFPSGLWPNPDVLPGSSAEPSTLGLVQVISGTALGIKRIIDIRSPEEKVHKLLIEAPPTSRGRPIENFIFRLEKTPANTQIPFEIGKVMYVGKSENTAVSNQYMITLLSAYTNNEGISETNSGYYPTLDLDFDPASQSASIVTNPANSITYQRLNVLLQHIGYSSNQIETMLSLSNAPRILPEIEQIDIEFNKPTIIRCGGQTWEYVGYYNYQTAIPQMQNSQIGSGQTDAERLRLKLIKLQNSRFGGRIYATGLDEEGNSYVGTRITNTRTGEETDSRSAGTEESLTKSYTKLNIVSDLNMVSGSKLRVYSGSEINIDNGAVLKLGGVTSQDAKAYYQRTNDGVDIRRPGFAQPATHQEVTNEASLFQTGNGFNYVTPESLGRWRRERKLVAQREGITRIYIGIWTIGGVVRNPTVYNASYLTRYWPEPSFPAVPLSSNPGLDFMPFATLAHASAWANAVLAPTETAELFVAPGLYDINAEFNCNVILRGAYGQNLSGNPLSETESVLLYKSLSPGIDTVRAGEPDAGLHYIRDIRLTGRLTIKGPGLSEISNVFVIDPEVAYKKVYDRNRPSGTPAFSTLNQTAIEHVIRNALGVLRANVFDRTNFRYPSSLVQNSELRWVLNLGDTTAIRKENGTLRLRSCVFYPQAPTTNLENGTPGAILHLKDSTLDFSGCAIRGVGRWTVPTNIVAGTLGANTDGYLLLDGSQGRAHFKSAYTSNVSGEYVSGGLDYYTFYGTAHSFIAAEGRSGVRIAAELNRRNNLVTRDYNDDRNNIRLERNHTTTIGFSDSSDYGTATLGLPRDPSVDFDPLSETTFVNSIPTLGPLFEQFFIFATPQTSLYIEVSSWRPDTNSRAGIRGVLSWIPARGTTSARILTGLATRAYGFMSGTFVQGNGCILTVAGLGAVNGGIPASIWNAPGAHQHGYTAANERNVYSMAFSFPTTSISNNIVIPTSPQYTATPGVLVGHAQIPYLFQKGVNPASGSTGTTPPESIHAEKQIVSGQYISPILLYNFSVSRAVTI